MPSDLILHWAWDYGRVATALPFWIPVFAGMTEGHYLLRGIVKGAVPNDHVLVERSDYVMLYDLTTQIGRLAAGLM